VVDRDRRELPAYIITVAKGGSEAPTQQLGLKFNAVTDRLKAATAFSTVGRMKRSRSFVART